MGCLDLYLYLYCVSGTGLVPVLWFTFCKTNVITQLFTLIKLELESN